MPISSISINLGSTDVSLLFSTRNNLPKCSTVCCWEKGIQNRIHTWIAIGQTLCKYLKCKWKFTLRSEWVDIPGFLEGYFLYWQKPFLFQMAIFENIFVILPWVRFILIEISSFIVYLSGIICKPEILMLFLQIKLNSKANPAQFHKLWLNWLC